MEVSRTFNQVERNYQPMGPVGRLAGVRLERQRLLAQKVACEYIRFLQDNDRFDPEPRRSAERQLPRGGGAARSVLTHVIVCALILERRAQRARFGAGVFVAALFFLAGAAFFFAEAASIACRASVFSPRRNASAAAIHSGA